MHNNLGLDQMEQHLDAFLKRLKYNDEVIFYFSGHGLQYRGKQLFVPCEMEDPAEECKILSTAFSVDEAIKKICYAASDGFKLIISDACREEYEQVLKTMASQTGVRYDEVNIRFQKTKDDNEDDDGPQKGGKIKKQKNLVRLFAVSQGQRATAGLREELSVYTKSLIKCLSIPNKSVFEISTMVSEDLEGRHTSSEILIKSGGKIVKDFRFKQKCEINQ